MEKYTGKTVFNGIAIGRILYYAKEQEPIVRKRIEDTEVELLRYEQAKETAVKQLRELYEKALPEVGEVNAQIFEVHSMLLEDEDYNESVTNMIRSQKVNAEYAVTKAGEHFAEMFSNMDDEYFRGRAADMKDISERVTRILLGRENTGEMGTEPVIVVAEDLAPSETVKMDKSKLLGFVTRFGSINSHTAILARTMSIPALIGIEIKKEWDKKQAIIDGKEGIFYVDPDEATLLEYRKKKEKEEERKRLYQTLKGKETVTRSGKKVRLYANIGNVADLATVLLNDAEGIGLFRSEFLYLESKDYPTEEEQFQVYKRVAETMAGKKVIIRTLDIGADKQADYFGLEKEENPAMGFRAIRICLARPEIFKTQLRALFRASAYGTISIMYPMITSLEEVRQIRRLSTEARQELEAAGITVGQVEEGIMIETPAAALISDQLAKEVDFFSIGTNDLTQYTLAIDRQNPSLDEFYNAHHEAVLRMIHMVAQNAHAAGIWVGICGELGADMELTETFLEMGIDELSVSPGYILPIRKIILDAK